MVPPVTPPPEKVPVPDCHGSNRIWRERHHPALIQMIIQSCHRHGLRCIPQSLTHSRCAACRVENEIRGRAADEIRAQVHRHR